MKRARLTGFSRTFAIGLMYFSIFAIAFGCLWLVRPLFAGGLGLLVVFVSVRTALRSTGPRQAASVGMVAGFLVGSVVALLSGTHGAA